MSIKEQFEAVIDEFVEDYDICGLISRQGKIFPLGSDTKVLSTVFELFSRPIILEFAKKNGYKVIEPESQNHYPDFTLVKHGDLTSHEKIAIDVKTTYVIEQGQKFSYTLGGYTSFIRNNTKNIVFPFSEYTEHWILGYVYTRLAAKKAAEQEVYAFEQLEEIEPPYSEVEYFFQEKWKIAGDKAGSGNTTNIGSIRGLIQDFRKGASPFKSEDEFLEYWRNYGTTAEARKGVFSTYSQFLEWKKQK